jgi:hypothetical protein
VAVRQRRDFGQLLTLVRVHALLHRSSRECDAEGRIVATLEDYGIPPVWQTPEKAKPPEPNDSEGLNW